MTNEWHDTLDQAAGNESLVSHDRVADTLYRVIRQEVYALKSITLDQLAAESGVPIRMLRAFIENQEHDRRPPPACYLLSIILVLGPRAVNSVMSLIGYSAFANNGKPITEVADQIVTMLAPFASKGKVRG